MLRGRNMADFRRTEAVMIGGGEEVIAKLAVEHDDPIAVQMFAREQFSVVCAMAPGASLTFGVQVQPMMHLISFTVPKTEVTATINAAPYVAQHEGGFVAAMVVSPPILPAPEKAGESVPLERLAFARSGEKGETINIGVIARTPAHLPALRAALSPAAIKVWLADLADFSVTLYDVPGISAINIVLDGALPGGINASQRLDPAAKSIGQRLMRFPVAICL
jgi:hypothetical protein